MACVGLMFRFLPLQRRRHGHRVKCKNDSRAQQHYCAAAGRGLPPVRQYRGAGEGCYGWMAGRRQYAGWREESGGEGEEGERGDARESARHNGESERRERGNACVSEHAHLALYPARAPSVLPLPLPSCRNRRHPQHRSTLVGFRVPPSWSAPHVGHACSRWPCSRLTLLRFTECFPRKSSYPFDHELWKKFEACPALWDVLLVAVKVPQRPALLPRRCNVALQRHGPTNPFPLLSVVDRTPRPF